LSCCYCDIKPFLCIVEERELAGLLGSSTSDGEGQQPERNVTKARLRRAFQRPGATSASQDGLTSEVRSLLEAWVACTDAREGSKNESSHPGAAELLALASAELLDLDRACVQQWGAGIHLVSAIVLAELGLETDQLAFQLKVILAILYGALGASGMMVHVWNTMDIKNIQRESLSYVVLDSLRSSGSFDAIRDVCRQVVHFHEDIDKDGGDVLTLAFRNGVLHRIPEYLQALESMNRSAMWAVSVVEETVCDLAQAQTQEAINEALGRQSVMIRDIVGRPLGHWQLRNTDRCVLSGLHPLPFCTPLGDVRHNACVWLDGSAPPTTLVRSVKPVSINSSALFWEDPPAGTAEASGSVDELSALEELIARRSTNSSSHVKLTASLVEALSALLQRDGSKEERLASALRSANEAASAFTMTQPSCGAATLTLWSLGPDHFLAHAQRCTLTACEAANAMVLCIAAKERWEEAERLLSLAATSAKELLVRCRSSSSTSSDKEGNASAAAEMVTGIAFGLGCCGIPWLWALLHDLLPILIPVVLWCCSSLPKAGGKKAKEGQEALHATRVALKGLLGALQTNLTEIEADLAAAQQGDGGTLLTEPTLHSGSEEVLKLTNVPGFVTRHQRVRGALLETHRRQLATLREAVTSRLALLRTHGTFKP